MSRPAELPHPHPIRTHAAATVRLATPLAAAQLAQMAMGATNTILLGALGGDALAVGGLSGAIEITTLVILQGVLTAVSVLVAQARGAGRDAAVPGLYWAGHALSALLILPAFALFSFAEPLLLLLGEPPALARGVGEYLRVLRWAAPGLLLALGMMRAFLPTVGAGRALLVVIVAEAGANLVLCEALIHGRLPALGLPSGTLGAAWATVIVASLGGLALLLYAQLAPRLRRFTRLAAPPAGTVGTMLRLGMPVSGAFAVESGLFLAVGLIMGMLGPAALAGQQVALTVTSLCFMVPLGLAQAANIRVGNHVGAADGPGARRAGLVAIALGALVEFIEAGAVLLFAPAIAAFYLPLDDPGFPVALSLLYVATAFQVADGIQAVASGALRGLGDTRVPFLLAAFAYWGVGFPAVYVLALHSDAGPEGAWWGLAASLIVVAALFTHRFLRRTAHSVPGPIPAAALR